MGTVLIKYIGDAAEVVIPANLGITEIGDDAFNMSGIKTVNIPEGVQRIGARAFNDCYFLEEVRLPESLMIVGSDAFRHTNITLPANIAYTEYLNISDIIPGVSHTTTLRRGSGNEHFYRIVVPNDAVLNTHISGSVDAVMTLYDADWKQIARANALFNQRITDRVSAGIYYIRIHHGGWYLGSNPSADRYSIYVATENTQ
jgi:hypothetical protein